MNENDILRRRDYLIDLGFTRDDASYYHGHGIFSDIKINWFDFKLNSPQQWEETISPIKVIIRDDTINQILD
jgi:hypothetical protein